MEPNKGQTARRDALRVGSAKDYNDKRETPQRVYSFAQHCIFV